MFTGASIEAQLRAFLHGTARRLLWARTVEAAAGAATAAGLVAAALELVWLLATAVGRPLPVGRWQILLVVPAAAAIGALARLIRGVSLHQAAAFMDVRGGLQERLTTALELAEAGGPEESMRHYACWQALRAAQASQAAQASPWRSRSQRFAAPLTLTLLACVVLALLGGDGRGTSPRDLAARLAAVPRDQRQALSADLRQAAGEAGQDSQLAAELLQAADVVEVGDSDRLAALLPSLQEAARSSPGRALSAVGELLAALKRAGAGVAGKADGEGPGGSQPSVKPNGGDGPRRPAPAAVNVYDPLYKPPPSGPEGGEGLPATSAGAEPLVPYADAWAAARARADQALRQGQVPAQYTNLVRDFFLSAPGDGPDAQGTE